jgi:hypothetical protein
MLAAVTVLKQCGLKIHIFLQVKRLGSILKRSKSISSTFQSSLATFFYWLSPCCLAALASPNDFFFRQPLFATDFQVFFTPPSTFTPPPPLFFRHCVMFAEGRQSHVSSVDAVTLRHAQPKLKHLAMHWANQTATDGVRQVHGMYPMERTQLSREQSECLVGRRAGIRVSWAGTPNTIKIIRCTTF